MSVASFMKTNRLGALLTFMSVALALMVGACSCDDIEPWGATYINLAEAAPPACEVDTNTASAEASGAHVDPNLLEIARLEVERDCYKDAAAGLRRRLQEDTALK